jgi:thioredoxin-like negative regulator of GroEL
MLKKFFQPSLRNKIDMQFKEALALRDKGDYKGAQELLEETLKMDPDSEIIKLKLWQVEKLNKNSGAVQNEPTNP